MRDERADVLLRKLKWTNMSCFMDVRAEYVCVYMCVFFRLFSLQMIKALKMDENLRHRAVSLTHAKACRKS